MQTLVLNVYHDQFRSKNTPWELAQALAPFDKRYLELKAIHEAQVDELARNKEIHDKVNAVMAEIGMPTTYRVRDDKSRRNIKPWLTLTSGYILDLRREFPLSDGWETVEKNYAAVKEQANKRAQEIVEENDKKQATLEYKAKYEAEQRKRNLEIARLQIKYNLDVEEYDVEYVLRRNNPLLNLAVAMEDTRNDWSDGFYLVENALTEEVRKINPEIYEAVYAVCYDEEDWDKDGRVFRDMKWNYNEIYSLLDKELVEDYNKVRRSLYHD